MSGMSTIASIFGFVQILRAIRMESSCSGFGMHHDHAYFFKQKNILNTIFEVTLSSKVRIIFDPRHSISFTKLDM